MGILEAISSRSYQLRSLRSLRDTPHRSTKRMKMHPREILGESLAIFVYDVDGDCGGSSVLFGTARFSDGQFIADRIKEPKEFMIPESAWHTLRENDKKEKGSTFEEASYVVTLLLGKMPEGDDPNEYERIEMPEL